MVQSAVLQHHVEKASAQGDAAQIAGPLDLSAMPEDSLAAKQQQKGLTELLREMTFYLKQDMQQMQEMCDIFAERCSTPSLAGSDVIAADSLQLVKCRPAHCMQHRQPWH